MAGRTKIPATEWVPVSSLPPTSKIAARRFWMEKVAEAKANPGMVGDIGVFSPGITHLIKRGDYVYFLPDHPVSDKARYIKKHWDISYERGRVEGERFVCNVLISWIGLNCGCAECL